MKPIYEPKGPAKEYGDLAINIYTGCPHRCSYCYVPNVLKIDRDEFHKNISVRKDVVNAVREQLQREKISDKLIHLCFTCDPYPTGHDSQATRDIISLIKATNNHVQILTKGDGSRDFDLLDENDWYGVTLDGTTSKPIATLRKAHDLGIKTWVSFEPVINTEGVLKMISDVADFIDKVKIGKLNHMESDTDWKTFGEKAESLCKSLKLNYYIKASLRDEMK